MTRRHAPLIALCLALAALPATAQEIGVLTDESIPIWGPTFSISLLESAEGVLLEWTGHAALNAESRRIDTLDIMVKYDDGKKAEKYRQEGVSELKEGTLELEGAWKEIRLSYKTRRPGTVSSKNPRINCRLTTKKHSLPAFVHFESYKEGPRCKIEVVEDAS
ncbi:MAG: hypothetical protein AAF725_08175 [Acidobacteriota bacterium]